MYLDRLYFSDKSINWTLKELFFNKFTLLVGASGVGKTMILNSIKQLKNISSGVSINGVEWELEFHTSNNDKYIWKGAFEKENASIFLITQNDTENKYEINTDNIKYEQLFLNGNLLVDRNNEQILFNNAPTVKLSKQKSVIYLLKEEELIKPVYDGLTKLYFYDNTQSVKSDGYEFSFLNAHSLIKSYNTIDKIQNSTLNPVLKLYFAARLKKDKTFETIKNRYIDIFPQVEDIKIESLDIKTNDMPNILKDYPFIQIKEKGVEHWIPEQNISSGMFRTLIQLSELYLCPNGSVLFVDEFENSLGANCINEITSDILSAERDLQFVFTSHHPFIINSIQPKDWKLVTRESGLVSTKNAENLINSNSSHDAFMQLIQLDEFKTGRDA